MTFYVFFMDFFSELVPGVLSYLMHMDHNQLDTLLECMKCKK